MRKETTYLLSASYVNPNKVAVAGFGNRDYVMTNQKFKTRKEVREKIKYLRDYYAARGRIVKFSLIEQTSKCWWDFK